MRSSIESCGLYAAFARNSFLKMLAYRLRYYTGIFTYLMFVSVYYYIWSAIYANRPAGDIINGYSLSEMTTYVVIGWIARSFYFSNIDSDIEDIVRSGEVSMFLIRPVSFQLMMISQAVGESLFRFVLFSIPISLVILWIYPVQPPSSISAAILFLIATLFGFLILALINFIVGLLAFFFQSIDGISRAKQNIIQLASGLILPLAFFPSWVRVVLEYLPLKMITDVPLRCYLGKIDFAEAMHIFGVASAWTLALALAGSIMWKRAASTLTIQGG
jgi:ABC-2 type transport system permease protein